MAAKKNLKNKEESASKKAKLEDTQTLEVMSVSGMRAEKMGDRMVRRVRVVGHVAKSGDGYVMREAGSGSDRNEVALDGWPENVARENAKTFFLLVGTFDADARPAILHVDQARDIGESFDVNLWDSAVKYRASVLTRLASA